MAFFDDAARTSIISSLASLHKMTLLGNCIGDQLMLRDLDTENGVPFAG